ncbi:MAG: serine hydrolase [Clostridia bacterium]|nr:serine hydrolase [Clostridia bacterium]
MQQNPQRHTPPTGGHRVPIGSTSQKTSQVMVAVVAVILALSLIVLFSLVSILKHRADAKAQEVALLSAELEEKRKQTADDETMVRPIEIDSIARYTANTKEITEQINSEYAFLLDVTNNEVVAHKNGEAIIYPASMTKVMTLIVAIENIEDLNDTFTFDYTITDPAYEAGASIAGFLSSETVPLIDILYGIHLPSGADAATAIAIEVAGTEEAFVEMMNDKAKAMGLTNTHFVNASGLHDPNHYTTPHEMAKITEYAMKNPIIAEIMSEYQYTTTPTPQHPDGLLLTSTMFSYMRGDEVDGIDIFAGKTGYTTEARRCLASVAETEDGKRYILVTANGYSAEDGDHAAVYDAFDIYREYVVES